VAHHHDLNLQDGGAPDVLAAVVHAANEICRAGGMGGAATPAQRRSGPKSRPC